MVKKKPNVSLFSALAQQIEPASSSAECHRVDNECFAAFDTLDDMQHFQQRLIEAQATSTDPSEPDVHGEEDDEREMDMKRFAAQFLIDSPERTTASSDSSSNQASLQKDATGRKRQRRNVRDLPQSSHFLFMSDDDDGNIFSSLKEKRSSTRTNRISYEDMSAILLTLDVPGKKNRKQPSRVDDQVANEPTESSLIIKAEPLEQEQVRLARCPATTKGYASPSLAAHHHSCDRSQGRTGGTQCTATLTRTHAH